MKSTDDIAREKLEEYLAYRKTHSVWGEFVLRIADKGGKNISVESTLHQTFKTSES